jgi:hypothetical protein
MDKAQTAVTTFNSNCNCAQTVFSAFSDMLLFSADIPRRTCVGTFTARRTLSRRRMPSGRTHATKRPHCFERSVNKVDTPSYEAFLSEIVVAVHLLAPSGFADAF